MSLIAIELTRRQIEILDQVRDGQSLKEVAAALNISQDTVKNHLAQIKERLSARNTLHSVTIAYRCGFVEIIRKGVNIGNR